MMTFAKVLESAEELPVQDQEDLVATLRRRLSEQRREEIIAAVGEARKEHADGTINAASADSIADSLSL